MKTYIDVVDTAVKIGLGALIAGGASYLIAHVAHKKERKKERTIRRNNILQQAAEEIEVFTHSLLRIWALIIHYARYNDLGKTPPLILKEKIDKESDSVIEAYKNLTNAEAKLLLLSLQEAQTTLRRYGETGKRIFKISLKSASEEDLEGLHNKFMEQRKALFTLLSKDFNA